MFLRILIILLLISVEPVFVLEISTSIMGFIAFGSHMGNLEDFLHHCTVWTLLDSGVLRYAIISIFIPGPVYMYVQFSLLQQSIVSRMFIHLSIGIILWISVPSLCYPLI